MRERPTVELTEEQAEEAARIQDIPAAKSASLSNPLFQNYRSCGVTTLLGWVVYERAYYHCSACHHGHFPTDAPLRIVNRQTPGASEVISLMGVLEPFEEGAHTTLPRVTGLNVSTSSVQRTTEAMGTDVAERCAAGESFAEDEVWKWYRDATGREVAYRELDATGVPKQADEVLVSEFNPNPAPTNSGEV